MLRAIFEWCNDNDYTPYLAVMVDAATQVPMQFVRDGKIVLNISYGATKALKMDNDSVRFNARFGGVAREVFVPVENVIAIYASENGQGMAFEAPTPGSRPKAAEPDSPPALHSVTSERGSDMSVSSPAAPDDEPDPPKQGGRPTLTRVK